MARSILKKIFPTRDEKVLILAPKVSELGTQLEISTAFKLTKLLVEDGNKVVITTTTPYDEADDEQKLVDNCFNKHKNSEKVKVVGSKKMHGDDKLENVNEKIGKYFESYYRDVRELPDVSTIIAFAPMTIDFALYLKDY